MNALAIDRANRMDAAAVVGFTLGFVMGMSATLAIFLGAS